MLTFCGDRENILFIETTEGGVEKMGTGFHRKTGKRLQPLKQTP